MYFNKTIEPGCHISFFINVEMKSTNSERTLLWPFSVLPVVFQRNCPTRSEFSPNCQPTQNFTLFLWKNCLIFSIYLVTSPPAHQPAQNFARPPNPEISPRGWNQPQLATLQVKRSQVNFLFWFVSAVSAGNYRKFKWLNGILWNYNHATYK